MSMLKRAASNCLGKSSYNCSEIGLLIYAGVYRSDYLMEPAYAALLAGELKMNAAITETGNKKTRAFDVFNGSMGFLNSCYVAQQMVTAGICETAMIVAAEIENNAGLFCNERLGVNETASAIILHARGNSGTGFSRFVFKYHTDLIGTYTTDYRITAADPYLHIAKDPGLEVLYLNCILPAVQELLALEGIDINTVNMIFPPQISSQFITGLSQLFQLPPGQFVDVVGEGEDLFSSSLTYALEYAIEMKLVKAGDIGLLIAVGSGLQVGCAMYHF
jgi:3-oxoacyl-[acyl-carrier-protein] synthase III